MEQIRDRGHEQYLENDGRHNMQLYGIAFYKKRCKVVLEKHCLGPEEKMVSGKENRVKGKNFIKTGEQ